MRIMKLLKIDSFMLESYCLFIHLALVIFGLLLLTFEIILTNSNQNVTGLVSTQLWAKY